ncbi:hypothetical protein DBT_2264 [Dissulfuribacter thermophilus]|uniref:Uncharacterized protein n=1 Tax=Dissulfuribacter thermophilus TaxID=1156395 RepID=A0A1B9F3Q0_9BACT|nr:hypothetical protein [Dissulfuribacter thermophilus]OCC14391.1 hypothetical protein DBT_2264 [Dissulfuribacter thermophilus]
MDKTLYGIRIEEKASKAIPRRRIFYAISADPVWSFRGSKRYSAYKAHRGGAIE